MELLEKAKENEAAGDWAKEKNYYNVAVSRYYYVLIQKIIYILNKENANSNSYGESSHKKLIDNFIDQISQRKILGYQEIRYIQRVHSFRYDRNKAGLSRI